MLKKKKSSRTKNPKILRFILFYSSYKQTKQKTLRFSCVLFNRKDNNK